MIPENTMIPEVAFVGRSNIGKSSLINGLVNRNGLVKTSSKPGHTRMMNFFKIGDKLSLVDMPGYGWKSRDEWGGMILSYLQNRKNLKRIYILIDPSHGLKESDTQIMKLLDGSGLSYQVVLTKVDKLSRTKYKAAKTQIEAALTTEADHILQGQVEKTIQAVVENDESELEETSTQVQKELDENAPKDLKTTTTAPHADLAAELTFVQDRLEAIAKEDRTGADGEKVALEELGKSTEALIAIRNVLGEKQILLESLDETDSNRADVQSEVDQLKKDLSDKEHQWSATKEVYHREFGPITDDTSAPVTEVK
ncbi:hypothetical protein BGX28_007524, partial [Mortierella sp. GBA30]